MTRAPAFVVLLGCACAPPATAPADDAGVAFVSEPVPFERWGVNEPNGGACLAFILEPVFTDPPGAWVDVDCNGAYPFVCDTDGEGTPDCDSVIILDEPRLLCSQARSAAEASAVCEEAGGTLSVVDSDLENDTIANQSFARFAGLFALLGGSDDDGGADGQWQWADGTSLPAPYSAWDEGAPDGGAFENCATMALDADARWDDADCADAHAALCDAGDGSFTVVDDAVSWPNAIQRCAQRGARLARIESGSAHAAALAAALADAPSGVARVWIGASDARREGTWRWADGGAVVDRFAP